MIDQEQSDPAKQSTEALFADETFEPQWMKDRREAERQALEEGVTIGVRKAWDQAAAMSRVRIADKYPSKKRLKRWDG